MGLGRSLYFSGLSSVLKVVVQFGLSIFVARLLTPADIGSFGVAMAASALVRAFESAGVNNFVASYKDLDAALMRTVFSANAVLNIGLALLLALVALPLGRFYGSAEVTDLVLVIALAQAMNTHLPIVQGSLRRSMRFKALLGLDMALMLVAGIVTVGGILLGYGPLSLAFALVAERIAGMVAGLTLYRREAPMGLRLAGAGVVFRYGFALSFATVIGIVGAHAGNIILGRVLGLAPSAQFDRGYTLPRLIWQVAQPSFQNVLVPEVARLGREGGDHRAVVADVVHAFAMLVWPAGLVLSLVSPEAVLLLFGDQWRPAADIAPWLLLYGLMVSPMTLAAASLVAFGHGRPLVNLQLAENGLKVLILLLAGTVGFMGLAYLMVLPPLVYALGAFLYLKRLDLIVPRAFLAAFIGPLRVSLVSALPCLFMLRYAGPDTFLDMGQLLIVAGASVLVYLGCLWLWDRHFITRLLALLKPSAA